MPYTSFLLVQALLLFRWRFPVLTVHLLGHAHVTQNAQPVPLSAKAVALIAYLAAEKLPQHRERLADLLWNTAEARTNLRVELARIRSAGLNIFPASRQLLYLESISTDIDQWHALQEHEMNQTELSSWLATLRGLPLCGLEDLGSTGFQVWVEQQRWMLCEKVENTLSRVYAHYSRSGQEWATRIISSRAEAVGFADPAELLTEEMINEALPLVLMARATGQPQTSAQFARNASPSHMAADQFRAEQFRTGQLRPDQQGAERMGGEVAPRGIVRGPDRRSAGRSAAGLPVTGSPASGLTAGALPDRVAGPGVPTSETPGSDLAQELHFARPNEERQLQDLLHASQSQTVMLHGPPGSGKTYLAERLARALPAGWEVLRLTAARSGRLLLAALAQSLLRLAEPDQVLLLRQVLLQPGAIEEDMVKVAVALSHLDQPLLLLFDEVHDAPPELTGMLELICQMSPASVSPGPVSPSAAGPARLFVLLGREEPSRRPVTRTLLRRLPGIRVLALPPVTLNSVQQVLLARYPGEEPLRLQPLASRLTQRSEGNPLHLLSLLRGLPDASAPGRADLSGVTLGNVALPQVVRDTLRSEPEGWSEPLRDAMSRLSVINGAFDRAVAQAVLNLESEGDADALLCDAIERQIVLEIDPGLALSLDDLTPMRLTPEADTQYMFRREALRVTLAGQLPQFVRQDVRRRLSAAHASSEPGLASYYAERAGLGEQARLLWAEYQASLPHDSPLLNLDLLACSDGAGVKASVNSGLFVDPASTDSASALPVVAEPARLVVTSSNMASHQGYTVSLEAGWLNVMSDGRYGHPQTLTLCLNWPQPLNGDLRLVWRLDVFGGGEELRPSQNPFPLRLIPVRAGAVARSTSSSAEPSGQATAFVFSPRASGDYREQHLNCLLQPGVELGQWMEHRLSGPEWQGATGAEISVRALDVALTIGVIGPVEASLSEGVQKQAGERQCHIPAPSPALSKKVRRGTTVQAE